VLPLKLSGQRFGMLVVLQRAPTRQGRTHWHCACDCGKHTTVATGNLGRITWSCGCYRSVVASARKTKPVREVIATQIWNYYKRNAAQRGLLWELTKEQFTALIFLPCHYCGNVAGTVTAIAWKTKSGQKRTLANNGIDRVDNTLGYSKDNCVPACCDCNLSKNDRSADEFIAWARRLVAHQDAQEGGA
jgi:hypothetical protein